MNKYILTLFCFLTQIAWCSDTATQPTNTYYAKVGTEFGVGYRLHQDAHGCDFSLNYTALSRETWIGAKALYLFYPLFRSNNYFYIGAGGSVIYGTLDLEKRSLNSKDGLSGPYQKTRLYPAFETVIGYEFPIQKQVKLFTQMELLVPVGLNSLFKTQPGSDPKLAVTFGVGF